MRKPVVPVPVIAPASALVWWIVGYLPWLIGGAADDVTGADAYSVADQMVALPLLTDQLALLVLGGVGGGACAGLLTLLSDGRSATTLAASFAGLACAVLVAGIWSTSVLGNAELGNDGDASVLAALMATASGATLLGWLFGAGGYFGRVPLGIALCGLAGALSPWLSYVVFSIDPYSQSELVSKAIGYAGAALLAFGLVVIGVRPYVRLLAWPAAVVLAWIVAPALVAAGYLGVMLSPPATVSDSLGPAWDVFVLAAKPTNAPADWLVPFVVATGLALVVSVRLVMRSNASGEETHSPVEPSSSSRTTSR
ncbi:hypothetical protein [Solicola gregarius]|uniref:Uncharacterized protein n=1 Tax=Solicola gregarius TaxID=2908642 RepID=A0AA46YKC4_9ACTN|nr:hypothetical protein [Solicola gregarius]UYM03838.1 hypothetical protein L0C25_14960 [Solicola gregarius]